MTTWVSSEGKEFKIKRVPAYAGMLAEREVKQEKPALPTYTMVIKSPDGATNTKQIRMSQQLIDSGLVSDSERFIWLDYQTQLEEYQNAVTSMVTLMFIALGVEQKTPDSYSKMIKAIDDDKSDFEVRCMWIFDEVCPTDADKKSLAEAIGALTTGVRGEDVESVAETFPPENV